MIVVCGNCGAKSRLNAAKVPKKGARLPCPKCATVLRIPPVSPDTDRITAFAVDGQPAPAAEPGPAASDPALMSSTGTGWNEAPAGHSMPEPERLRSTGMKLPWEDDLAQMRHGVEGPQDEDTRVSAMPEPPPAAGRTMLFGKVAAPDGAPEGADPVAPAARGGTSTFESFSRPTQAPFETAGGPAPGGEQPVTMFEAFQDGPPPPSAGAVPAAGGVTGAGGIEDLFGDGPAPAAPPPDAPTPADFLPPASGEPDEETVVARKPALRAEFTALNMAAVTGTQLQAQAALPPDLPPEEHTQVRAAGGGRGMGELDDLFGGMADGPDANSATPALGTTLPRPDDAIDEALAHDQSLLEQLSDLGASPGMALYRVRRPNGRIFGPFPVAVIIEMIQAGKLSGSEDLSQDGDSFVPLVEIPELADAVERYGRRPTMAPASGMGAASIDLSPDLLEERRRIEEEARIRQQQDIFRTRSALKKRGLQLPRPALIGAAVGVVGLLVAVYLLVFGGGPGEGEHCLRFDCLSRPRQEQLHAAEGMLLRDTAQASEEAVGLIDELLQGAQFPGRPVVEAMGAALRTLYVVRFGPRPQWEEEARRMLASATQGVAPELWDRTMLLAQGAEYMRAGNLEEARNNFQRMLRQVLGQGQDVLGSQLIALSFLGTPQSAQGMKYLEPVLESDQRSAFTFYLAGRFHEAAGDIPQAKASYQSALDMLPQHADARLALLELSLDEQSRDQVMRELERMRDEQGRVLSVIQKARVHYMLSRIYCAQGANFKCVTELRRAITANPGSDVYRETLGQYHLGRREMDEALEEFTQCQRLNPRNESCHLGMVEVYLERGQYLKAQEALRTAESATSRTPAIAFAAGRVLEAQQNWDGALRAYEEAIGLRRTVEYLVAAARIYHRQDRADKYAEYVQLARGVDPRDARIHILLGDIARDRNLLVEAEREYREVIALDANHADAHYRLAGVLRLLRRFPEAVEEYNRVLALDERNGRAREGLGDTYYDQRQVDRAVLEFEAAKELLVREDPRLHFKLGLCYYFQQRLDDARNEFTRAVSLEAELDNAHYMLGRVFFDQENYERARASFEEALGIRRSGVPEYYYWLGLAYFTMARNQQAIENFDRAITEAEAKSECYGEAHMYRGIVLKELKDLRESFQALNRALRCNAELSLAHRTLAEMYLTAHDRPALAQAKVHIRSYLRMNPNDWQGYELSGRILQATREYRESSVAFRQALDRRPEECWLHREMGYNAKTLNQTAAARGHFQSYLRCACPSDGPPAVDCEEIRSLLSHY